MKISNFTTVLVKTGFVIVTALAMAGCDISPEEHSISVSNGLTMISESPTLGGLVNDGAVNATRKEA